MDHAVLEDSLPLVLDTRDLVIHTEHNVDLAFTVLAVVVIAQLVVAVVKVRVDDFVAGKEASSIRLRTRRGAVLGNRRGGLVV